MKVTLHTLKATALHLTDGEAPSRLVVFPWGTHPTRRGKFIVSDLTASVFAGNQAKMRLDGKIALDFEHNTLPGTTAFKNSPEPRAVAAWGLAAVEPQVGIVLTDLEWTPEGLTAWKGRHYQDLSPSPFRDAENNVIALHSVALVRHGEVEGLTLHAAASKEIAAFLCALSADADPTTPDPALANSMKDALSKLLALLGQTVSAETDEAGLTTALTAAIAKVNELTQAKGGAEPMSAEIQTRFDALSGEFEGFKKAALIQQATAAGKVIGLSAEALKIVPLSALEELVKNAKAGEVPTGKAATDGDAEAKEKPEALSAETAALSAQMGLTEAEVRKYGLGQA